MSRARIHSSDAEKVSAYADRMTKKGMTRKTVYLTPEAITALRQLKLGIGVRHDSQAISAALVMAAQQQQAGPD